MNHTFPRVLREAGLLHIRFHDLRHTHATLMLQTREHTKVVNERLGHSNVAFTLDTYSHVVPDLQEVAAERFDRFVLPVIAGVNDAVKPADIKKTRRVAKKPAGIHNKAVF